MGDNGNARADRRQRSTQAGLDPAYASEEIVAELASAFLAADLGIKIEPRADHASYIANWLQAMKEDKRFISTAAAHAQRAADYLHGLQPAGPA